MSRFQESDGKAGQSYASARVDTRPADAELSAKFASELSVEQEASGSGELPPAIQDFLDNSQFQV